MTGSGARFHVTRSVRLFVACGLSLLALAACIPAPDAVEGERSEDVIREPPALDSVVDNPAEEDAEEPEGELAAMERDFHERINAHRASSGLPALEMDADLARLARGHSRAMASGAVPFGHGGFDDRAAAYRERRSYREFAENVAFNDYPAAATVATAVEGLLKSPGHRKNIDGDFARTGVGVARTSNGAYYYTQLFAR